MKNGKPYIDDYVKLIDMIYRYVYFKTPWYADLKNYYYVDISDSLMDKLKNLPLNFDIKLLYLQLLLLSLGWLINGQSPEFMRESDMQYNRLRNSRSHAFTWIGYERIDN